jgi:hypothetical protein
MPKSQNNKRYNTLQVKPIPIPLTAVHPEPPNDVLPKHEFTIGIIGKLVLTLTLTLTLTITLTYIST